MVSVFNGVDNLSQYAHLFKGARVGLITAPAAVTRGFVSVIDALGAVCSLTALFSPEHGVRGDLQAGDDVHTYIDPKTGVPVYSIYGGDNRPDPEMLEKIDILVMDVFDVGSRYYTYLATLMNAMEACAPLGKKVVVLDRINPIGGTAVEGNFLNLKFKSFVGTGEFPQRHGLTMGEIGHFFNAKYNIGCDYHVVPLSGWQRAIHFNQTDLPWINPSPNIPGYDCALVYNGTCLIEGTNLSEGRGTTKPFELLGAPWLDADKLAQALNAKGLPGVHFREAYFMPTFSKHAQQVCAGVQVHVTDAQALRPVEMGLHLIKTLITQSGEHFAFVPPGREAGDFHMDLLAGCDDLRKPDFDPEAVAQAWAKDTAAFLEQRKPYLLYA